MMFDLLVGHHDLQLAAFAPGRAFESIPTHCIVHEIT